MKTRGRSRRKYEEEEVGGGVGHEVGGGGRGYIMIIMKNVML
jgi:hypothetical protein